MRNWRPKTPCAVNNERPTKIDLTGIALAATHINSALDRCKRLMLVTVERKIEA